LDGQEIITVALHSSLNDASKLAVAAVFKVRSAVPVASQHDGPLHVLRHAACLGILSCKLTPRQKTYWQEKVVKSGHSDMCP